MSERGERERGGRAATAGGGEGEEGQEGGREGGREGEDAPCRGTELRRARGRGGGPYSPPGGYRARTREGGRK